VCVLWRWLQAASLPLDAVPEGVAEAEAAHIVLVVSDGAMMSLPHVYSALGSLRLFAVGSVMLVINGQPTKQQAKPT
jgi:hypothetical protein